MPDLATQDGPGALRVSVDLSRCQGYAQICYAGPDRFALRGRMAVFDDPASQAGAFAVVERR